MGLYKRHAVSDGDGAWDLFLGTLDAEHGRWFLWIPVCFGTGIAFYFALGEEPSFYTGPSLAAGAAGLCLAARSRPVICAMCFGLLCATLGFVNASLRTHMVATPALEGRDRVVALNAWVERIEPRSTGARLTLLPIDANSTNRNALPHRVRITSRFARVPQTGTAVAVRALLRPVPEPAIPHGFDFARKAYFNGIGAVGFAITEPKPVSIAETPPVPLRLRALVDAVRRGIDARISSALRERAAAISVALIIGDRGRIPKATLEALRHSGLAHLLAISGMHMALMAGALYWLIRAAAASVPILALRYPVKKWAAIAALAGGAFYLAISGGSVATQRAFLMMAIVFIAILLDRPALTLRNVALAALFILIPFPESLLDVSFQMSFAAVTALIAAYERLERRRRFTTQTSLHRRIARHAFAYVAGIALTTIVASIAIAPFAAFHFHKLAQYSLLANLAAMPVFGLLVMPMALASLIAMPLGLESYPLQVMAFGVENIVHVAISVSGWKSATVPVATMPVASLAALVFGGLWLTLWQTRWRYLGLPIALCGALLAGTKPKPDILIGRDGKLVAMRTAGNTFTAVGRSRPNYSLEKWLTADGDTRDPVKALEGRGFSCDELACIGQSGGRSVAIVFHPAALAEECARSDIVISQTPIARKCPLARVKLDLFDMKRKGAHALYFEGHSIRIESVAAARGNRPWAPSEIEKEKSGSTGTALAGEEAQ